MDAAYYKKKMLDRIRKMSNEKLQEEVDKDTSGFLKELCDQYNLMGDG